MARLRLADVCMWLTGGAILTLIVVGSAATLLHGGYTVRHWFDFVVFGLAQGSIYALIALGYTMVYGILRMINFAHGEVFMSGPYTAYFFAAALENAGWLSRHPVVSLAIIFAVAIGTSALVATYDALISMPGSVCHTPLSCISHGSG